MKKKIIKICGITNQQDAEIVSSYFPDFLGFVFYEESPRNISFENFREISDFLRVCFGEGCPKLTAVLVNPSVKLLEKIAPYIDVFQFHGDETPQFIKEIQKKFQDHQVWKALRIGEKEDLEKISEYDFCNGILLDSFLKDEYGGTGKKISDNILEKISDYKKEEQILLLAGGLNTENFDELVEKSGASGGDLSSSLESKPGKKSEKKVDEFFCR